ncbi:unnamed protein product [Clonostachys solani]|uniref:Uncharacterized protein n=1 Tax=Clonostachys solani TaxID=160281 RepID=A0A9P0EQ07_9HYPO|nr:unnamed protein product [Clonostachys solani]
MASTPEPDQAKQNGTSKGASEFTSAEPSSFTNWGHENDTQLKTLQNPFRKHGKRLNNFSTNQIDMPKTGISGDAGLRRGHSSLNIGIAVSDWETVATEDEVNQGKHPVTSSRRNDVESKYQTENIYSSGSGTLFLPERNSIFDTQNASPVVPPEPSQQGFASHPSFYSSSSCYSDLHRVDSAEGDNLGNWKQEDVDFANTHVADQTLRFELAAGNRFSKNSFSNIGSPFQHDDDTPEPIAQGENPTEGNGFQQVEIFPTATRALSLDLDQAGPCEDIRRTDPSFYNPTAIRST